MSKAVLVTGATGNLGQAVCQILSEANYSVFGTILPGSDQTSQFAETIEADLTHPEDAVAVVKSMQETHNTLHGVICLAGGFGMSNIKSTSTSEIASFQKLNFDTAFNIVQASWDWMIDSGGGQIVFIGAKPAVEGSAFEMLPYALSKGSLIQLAAILNENSNETGVNTSVIVPSIIDTPANRAAMPDADFLDWVSPASIGNQIAHLLSAKSSSLRNATLKMYGNS
jgi:NAD(P)-dependent dehydrogenase (short-subunit alcohol dehydrogenase family)